MFKDFWSFLKSLEKWERYEPSSFWLCSIGLYFSFSVGFGVLFLESPSQSQTVIEKNTASVLAQNRGGGESKQKSGSFVLRTGLGKRKKFDIVFHRRLEQHFPDWKARIDYQKKQEKFYKLAMKRRKEIKRLRMIDKKSYYTKDELDAMDYFHGTGFYQKEQDPKVKPNIFDTRQSFLLKMHDPVLRNNFLNSFNR
jgi:hypothetical protein